MRIAVAPDSFKGSLTAVEAAQAMERGIHTVWPNAEIIRLPVADGGEGTVEALLLSTSGKAMTKEVTGPLGERVNAKWGILGDGKTAVIEMAEASGLLLVSSERRDPRFTTTFGTGELIKVALDHGMRKIIIGIGGSATNDGGAGMAQALGAKFLDRDGISLPWGGAALRLLDQIDLREMDTRLRRTEIVVACDVDNPLCGPSGASVVYGPQKGATKAMVEELDDALAHFAKAAQAATGNDVALSKGAGAAGGLGAGLMYFAGAQMKQGIQLVLNTMCFEQRIRDVDLVITGEGCTDAQTVHGKAPVGVASLAEKYRIPVICLSGALGDGYQAVLEHGIAATGSIVPRPMALEGCIRDADKLLEQASAEICRLLQVGKSLR